MVEYDDDDDPLWKRILFHEFFVVFGAAMIILGIAFLLATRSS